MLLYTEGADKPLHESADEIMALLTSAYPGHPWAVRCDKGLVFIRHLYFGNKGYGMALRTKEVDYKWQVFAKKIVMLAGEWLERAGIRRGVFDADQEITRVEGVPEKDQPVLKHAAVNYAPDIDADRIYGGIPNLPTKSLNTFPIEESNIREMPRPQVKAS